MMVAVMREAKNLCGGGLFAFSGLAPSVAQQYGREYGKRPQDGFSSGQYRAGQYSGQCDGRLDDRCQRQDEGLPQKAQPIRTIERSGNPISSQDCAEVDSLNPDVRPGWQARVRAACNEN